MRETNINEDIHRTDVKVGDKIAINREVTVKAVRETTLYGGFGNPRKPVTIIDTDDNTLAITSDDTLKLLERDKEPIFTIPLNALVITWRDEDDYHCIARRNTVGDEWVTSDHGPGFTYTSEALVVAINEEFDGYKAGSFEVLKSKPYLTGGYVHGVLRTTPAIDSIDALRVSMVQPLAPSRNVLPRNFLTNGAASSASGVV